ncbi:MAG: GGDEF domain-containing protein [Bacilli bacterium]
MIFTSTVNISLLATNLIGIFALLFLIILVSDNRVFDRRRKTFFILASVSVMLMIVLEVLDYVLYSFVFDERYNTASFIHNIAITRYVIAFLEFSLCPLVPMFLINVVNSYKKNAAWISLIFSIGACVGNIFYPYIYEVTDKAEFIHGDFFLIPTGICLILMFALIIQSFKSYQSLKSMEKTAILLMILGIGGAAVLQYYVFVGSFLIWNTVAIFLVIYYLIVHIQMYLLDPLTGLFNRATWENDMREMDGRQDAILVMLDLNNLKKINDIYGHAEGDKAINRISHIVRLSLGKVGKCYRIGGDEFAVICRSNESRVAQAKALLEKYIAQQEYTVAYGFVKYDHKGEETIKEAFKKADIIMYEHKASIKRSQSLSEL